MNVRMSGGGGDGGDCRGWKSNNRNLFGKLGARTAFIPIEFWFACATAERRNVHESALHR